MSIKFLPIAFLFLSLLHGCGQDSPAKSKSPSEKSEYQEGVHYQVIKNKVDRPSNEILEFFWLGCPHCYSASPSIKKLLETSKNNPSLVVAHSQLYEKWLNDAGLFYAINHLTKSSDAINSYFVRRHTGKMSSQHDFDAFLHEYSLTIGDINSALQDPSVVAARTEMSNIEKSISSNGVPAFLIGGKYIVNLEKSYGNGKWDDVAAVIDYLVEKSRSEQ